MVSISDGKKWEATPKNGKSLTLSALSTAGTSQTAPDEKLRTLAEFLVKLVMLIFHRGLFAVDE